MRVVQEWKAKRSKGDAEKCPEDLLDNPDIQNYWLSRFVAEIRKQDGQPYLPRTIHQILAGLQRYMLEKQPNAPKFLDHTWTAFCELHGTCDSVYRGLHQEGVGTEIHHTSTFTAAAEQALQAKDVLGCTNPKNLQRAVFFYIGK